MKRLLLWIANFVNPICGAEGTDELQQQYVCTLKRGHEDKHVSHGTFAHQYYAWPNEEEKKA